MVGRRRARRRRHGARPPDHGRRRRRTGRIPRSPEPRQHLLPLLLGQGPPDAGRARSLHPRRHVRPRRARRRGGRPDDRLGQLRPLARPARRRRRLPRRRRAPRAGHRHDLVRAPRRHRQDQRHGTVHRRGARRQSRHAHRVPQGGLAAHAGTGVRRGRDLLRPRHDRSGGRDDRTARAARRQPGGRPPALPAVDRRDRRQRAAGQCRSGDLREPAAQLWRLAVPGEPQPGVGGWHRRLPVDRGGARTRAPGDRGRTPR